MRRPSAAPIWPGRRLTANQGTIADPDGVPAESAFTYQWIRVSGSIETDITGATSKTYTTVAADQGKKLKVKVSFADNNGNAESRTSLASEIIGAISCTPTAPSNAIWSACMTVDGSGYYFAGPGVGGNFGALSNPDVTVGGDTYTIDLLQTLTAFSTQVMYFGFTSAPDNAASAWVLHTGSASTSFALSAATTESAGKRYKWTGTSLTWSTGDVISVWIVAAVSNSAPVFPATETGARSLAENTASGQNVGGPGGGHGHRHGGHPDLQPGGYGQRVLHHRQHQRPNPDQRGARLRDQDQLLGDGQGQRRHGGPPPRRSPSASSTWRSRRTSRLRR